MMVAEQRHMLIYLWEGLYSVMCKLHSLKIYKFPFLSKVLNPHIILACLLNPMRVQHDHYVATLDTELKVSLESIQ